jgi:hypothetical protein
LAGLPAGTVIKNTGYIYFDFNSAIITDTTINLFTSAVTFAKSIVNEATCKVFPNPNNGSFTIQWSVVGTQNFVSIEIYNELGQVVYSQNITAAKGALGTMGTYTEQLNLSNLAEGIYTLRMQSNSSITVRKLEIIQR